MEDPKIEVENYVEQTVYAFTVVGRMIEQQNTRIRKLQYTTGGLSLLMVMNFVADMLR